MTTREPDEPSSIERMSDYAMGGDPVGSGGMTRDVGLARPRDEGPICEECGDDLVCEGYPYCSDCLERLYP